MKSNKTYVRLKAALMSKPSTAQASGTQSKNQSHRDTIESY